MDKNETANSPMQDIVTIENASISSRVRRMLGLSLHGWENVMVASLAFAAVFAAIVGIATYCVVQLQREQIAASRDEFEAYKIEAGKEVGQLKHDTAEANARQKEAELKLEQLREKLAARHINGSEFIKALEGKPKAPIEIVFVRDDPECWQLAMQIRDWLKTAKWEVSEPAAITGPDESRFVSYPSAMQAGGQPRGVTIVQRVSSQADFVRERDSFEPQAPVDTPAKALSRALMGSLGAISGAMSFETGTPGMLRVVVGPKL